MFEEHLQRVIVSPEGLGHKAIHLPPTGLTPANLVSGRDVCLSCDLLFGAPPNKEQPSTDQSVDLMDWLHVIHNYGRKAEVRQ
jgi:hypothetical protein